MAKAKIVSSDTIMVGDWYIKASQYRGNILIVMHNAYDGNFVMHYADDVKKANLIIEYVIEKGGFYD